MNEIVKSQSLTQLTDYKKRTSKRNWELSYGGMDKFYMTKEEKDLFLEQILASKDVVVINGNAFTRFFKSLVEVKGNESDELLKQIGL